jgi:hypothetical protein
MKSGNTILHWLYSSIVLLVYGIVALRYCDSTVFWYYCTVLWYCGAAGTMVLWNYGTVVLWYYGTTVLWYFGTVVLRTVLWYCGRVVEIFARDDGLVRTVNVKTSSTVKKLNPRCPHNAKFLFVEIDTHVNQI